MYSPSHIAQFFHKIKQIHYVCYKANFPLWSFIQPNQAYAVGIQAQITLSLTGLLSRNKNSSTRSQCNLSLMASSLLMAAMFNQSKSWALTRNWQHPLSWPWLVICLFYQFFLMQPSQLAYTHHQSRTWQHWSSRRPELNEWQIPPEFPFRQYYFCYYNCRCCQISTPVIYVCVYQYGQGINRMVKHTIWKAARDLLSTTERRNPVNIHVFLLFFCDCSTFCMAKWDWSSISK